MIILITAIILVMKQWWKYINVLHNKFTRTYCAFLHWKQNLPFGNGVGRVHRLPVENPDKAHDNQQTIYQCAPCIFCKWLEYMDFWNNKLLYNGVYYVCYYLSALIEGKWDSRLFAFIPSPSFPRVAVCVTRQTRRYAGTGLPVGGFLRQE